MSLPAHSLLRLSPHFMLREFASGDGVSFPATVVANLRRVAAMLEDVRVELSRILAKEIPVIVTSGYRSSAWNRVVGGVPRSYHLQGLAADVIAREILPDRIQKTALRLTVVGGVGCYVGFTHLDLGPRRVWMDEAGRLARGGVGQK